MIGECRVKLKSEVILENKKAEPLSGSALRYLATLSSCTNQKSENIYFSYNRCQYYIGRHKK